MADELRLPVRVVNEFSSPLAKLRNEMQSVARGPGLQQMRKDWAGVRTQVIDVSREVATGLTPAMVGAGAASFGVATAITAVALGVRNFALGARNVQLFSQETGIASQKLRVLQSLGERFEIDPSQMQGSLKVFSENFDKIKRNVSGIQMELRARGAGGLANDILSAKDVNTAVERAFKGLARIADPHRRQEIAKLLFGDEFWSTIAGSLGANIDKVLREIQDRISKLPAGTDAAANEFVENMSKIREAMEGIRVNAIGPLLPDIAQLIGALEKPLTWGGAEIVNTIKTLRDAIRDANKAYNEFANGEIGKGLSTLGFSWAPPMQPLPGARGEAEKTARDRLDGLTKQFDKLNGAIDAGKITGGARENAIGQRDRLGEEIRKLTEELVKLRQQGATIQQQSWGGTGIGGGAATIQTAAFGGIGAGFGGGPMADLRMQGSMQERMGAVAAMRRRFGSSGAAAASGGEEDGDAPASGRTEALPGARAPDAARRAARTNPLPGSSGSSAIPEINASAPVLPRNAPAGVGRSNISRGTNPDVVAYIRAAALKRGIDPNVAIAVANSEGLRGYDPDKMKVDRGGDFGTSFGPFQLHYKSNIPGVRNAGLGDVFTRRTGKHASDPSSWREQIDFALDEARKGGWGPWHGARNTGIPNWAGIGTVKPQDVSPEPRRRNDEAQGFDDRRTRRPAPEDYSAPWDNRFRAGDEMMRQSARAFGGLVPTGRTEHSAKIDLTINGLPTPNFRARSSLEGMFRQVNVSAGKGQMVKPHVPGEEI
ncbi:hypothetical protein [Chelatococcus reniformis]|uniref:Phage tail lysozyme domain-containing protein n=1 Tax=Chelatococcus reniformis TaxID=1494448 RepID=A0A916UVD3_9HYPH|nr:hypothetical protein [Chelatococcus reniformis]GGC90324.1 hypothetical protein GCM10010994_55200 [Chelatococcus reniformis]